MKVVRVAAALITVGDRCLVARRGKGRALEGYYELPGGKIEEGESPEEACVREIAEELKCRIEIESHFTLCEYDYPEQNMRLSMDVFVCTLPEGETIQRTEHTDLRFISAEEADRINFAPADLQFVPALKELLLQRRASMQNRI